MEVKSYYLSPVAINFTILKYCCVIYDNQNQWYNLWSNCEKFRALMEPFWDLTISEYVEYLMSVYPANTLLAVCYFLWPAWLVEVYNMFPWFIAEMESETDSWSTPNLDASVTEINPRGIRRCLLVGGLTFNVRWVSIAHPTYRGSGGMTWQIPIFLCSAHQS